MIGSRRTSDGVMRVGRVFTLIEMLVVIAIISILASMMVPSLRGALDTAKLAGCANNLKMMGTAYIMYSNDNNGYAEFAGGNFVWRERVHCVIGSTPSGIPTWLKHGSLYGGGYADAGQMYYCPSIDSVDYSYKANWSDPPATLMRSGYVPRHVESEPSMTMFYTGSQGHYTARISNMQSANSNKPIVLAYDFTKNENDANSSSHDPNSPPISQHPNLGSNMVYSDLHISFDNTGFYNDKYCLPYKHFSVNWDDAQ